MINSKNLDIMKENKVDSYWTLGWKYSNNHTEKLRSKFLSLSDDEIKELCKKFLIDNYRRRSFYLSDEYSEHWKLNTARYSYGDKDLLCAKFYFNWYDSIEIGLNFFGRCYIQEHIEHQPISLIYDISIDDFLEKYLQ